MEIRIPFLSAPFPTISFFFSLSLSPLNSARKRKKNHCCPKRQKVSSAKTCQDLFFFLKKKEKEALNLDYKVCCSTEKLRHMRRRSNENSAPNYEGKVGRKEEREIERGRGSDFHSGDRWKPLGINCSLACAIFFLLSKGNCSSSLEAYLFFKKKNLLFCSSFFSLSPLSTWIFSEKRQAKFG